MVLQGLKDVELNVKNGEGCLKYSLVNQQGWFLQLVAHDSQQTLHRGVDEVTKVVEEFADIFAEPVGLPPKRSFDHQIPLKENIGPISIRPKLISILLKDRNREYSEGFVKIRCGEA